MYDGILLFITIHVLYRDGVVLVLCTVILHPMQEFVVRIVETRCLIKIISIVVKLQGR